MTNPATTTYGRTAEVLQASSARVCILEDGVTDLRDDLTKDPRAHDHPLDSGESTDCLGCVVAARLTQILTEAD